MRRFVIIGILLFGLAPPVMAQSSPPNLATWGQDEPASPGSEPRSDWGEIKGLEPGSIDMEEANAPARATKLAQTTVSAQVAAPGQSTPPAKPRVAVLPFNVRGNLGIPDAGASIAEMLNGALAATGRYTLVERVLLQQLMEEQELQSSHLADEATLAEAGRLHGVEAIVSGTVIQWGETITLVARMIDTNTGVIRTSAEIKTKNRDSIPEQIDLLARKLAGLVNSTRSSEEEAKSLRERSAPIPAPAPAPNANTSPHLTGSKFAPSFDCGKAKLRQDHLVCANKELSRMDVELNGLYSKARAHATDKATLKESQLRWYKYSRNACSDVPCLLNAYESRIIELSEYLSGI